MTIDQTNALELALYGAAGIMMVVAFFGVVRMPKPVSKSTDMRFVTGAWNLAIAMGATAQFAEGQLYGQFPYTVFWAIVAFITFIFGMVKLTSVMLAD